MMGGVPMVFVKCEDIPQNKFRELYLCKFEKDDRYVEIERHYNVYLRETNHLQGNESSYWKSYSKLKRFIRDYDVTPEEFSSIKRNHTFSKENNDI